MDENSIIEDRSDVCIVVTHQNDIAPGLMDWINTAVSTNQCRDVVLHEGANDHQHQRPLYQKCLNAAGSRNEAREIALRQSKASRYLFLDSDVVPPIDALASFTAQDAPVIGGWYQRKQSMTIAWRDDPNREPLEIRPWVAGRWVSSDRVQPFYYPRTYRWIQSHVVPLGCVMIKRHFVETIEFEPGIDRVCHADDFGYPMIVGDCFSYGLRLHEIGVNCYMSPKIICEHVERSLLDQSEKPTRQLENGNQPKQES